MASLACCAARSKRRCRAGGSFLGFIRGEIISTSINADGLHVPENSCWICEIETCGIMWGCLLRGSCQTSKAPFFYFLRICKPYLAKRWVLLAEPRPICSLNSVGAIAKLSIKKINRIHHVHLKVMNSKLWRRKIGHFFWSVFRSLRQTWKKCIRFLHITPAAHLAQGILFGMLHTMLSLFFMPDAFLRT